MPITAIGLDACTAGWFTCDPAQSPSEINTSLKLGSKSRVLRGSEEEVAVVEGREVEGS